MFLVRPPPASPGALIFLTDRAATGWTIFDRLYVLNGTMYIVSDDPSGVPDRKWMVSEGHFIEDRKEAEEARLPSNKTMRVVSTAEAKELFGQSADLVDGVTVRASSSDSHSCSTRPNTVAR
jgi:prophage tail gpP-like protein